jgi:hypothetical protein
LLASALLCPRSVEAIEKKRELEKFEKSDFFFLFEIGSGAYPHHPRNRGRLPVGVSCPSLMAPRNPGNGIRVSGKGGPFSGVGPCRHGGWFLWGSANLKKEVIATNSITGPIPNSPEYQFNCNYPQLANNRPSPPLLQNHPSCSPLFGPARGCGCASVRRSAFLTFFCAFP